MLLEGCGSAMRELKVSFRLNNMIHSIFHNSGIFHHFVALSGLAGRLGSWLNYAYRWSSIIFPAKKRFYVHRCLCSLMSIKQRFHGDDFFLVHRRFCARPLTKLRRWFFSIKSHSSEFDFESIQTDLWHKNYADKINSDLLFRFLTPKKYLNILFGIWSNKQAASLKMRFVFKTA